MFPVEVARFRASWYEDCPRDVTADSSDVFILLQSEISFHGHMKQPKMLSADAFSTAQMRLAAGL